MSDRTMVLPPEWCRTGEICEHRLSGQLARIQRVYFNDDLVQWRVVLAGGREFVDHPTARAVPNAMPLAGFLTFWKRAVPRSALPKEEKP